MDNNENEHQLLLRMVSLGAGEKYELHIIEAEAMNYESNPIYSDTGNFENVHTAIGFPGDFEITHIALQLQCDSGTAQINGQHSVDVGGNAKSEDGEEENVKVLSIEYPKKCTHTLWIIIKAVCIQFFGTLCFPGKCLAPGNGSKFPQKKKRKIADDEDGDDDEDDDFDEKEAREKTPIKKSI